MGLDFDGNLRRCDLGTRPTLQHLPHLASRVHREPGEARCARWGPPTAICISSPADGTHSFSNTFREHERAVGLPEKAAR
jgi:hypothetical protein